MAKRSGIDLAIEQLESEKAVLEAAIAKLRAQQIIQRPNAYSAAVKKRQKKDKTEASAAPTNVTS